MKHNHEVSPVASSAPDSNPLINRFREVFHGTLGLTSVVPVKENNSFGKPIVALKKLSEVMKDQYLDWLRQLFGEENGVQKSSPKAFFWFWARCVRIAPFDSVIIDNVVRHLTRLFTTPESPRLRLEYPVFGAMNQAQIESYEPEASDYWEPEVTAKEKRKLERQSYPIVGDDEDDYDDHDDYNDYDDRDDYPDYLDYSDEDDYNDNDNNNDYFE